MLLMASMTEDIIGMVIIAPARGAGTKTGRKGEGNSVAISCFDRHASSIMIFWQSTALYVQITLVQKISQEPNHSPEVRLYLNILIPKRNHCYQFKEVRINSVKCKIIRSPETVGTCLSIQAWLIQGWHQSNDETKAPCLAEQLENWPEEQDFYVPHYARASRKELSKKKCLFE